MILDFFDYIAYRMHKFVITHPRMIVPHAAPILFTFIILYLPLMWIIVPICRVFNLNVHRYSGTWTIGMAILLILGWPIQKRYGNPENQKRFEKRWGNEEPKQRKIRGWLIWVLILINLMTPWLMILLKF